MPHPEEGIIHAWLDGALSPAESAELEAHVATCTACAATVAEARGLIAASSRIVGHLDIVPGSIIPSTSAKPRRSLVRTPWPAALAATLILGVTLYSRSAEAPSTLSQAPTRESVATMDLAETTALAPVTRTPVSRTPPPPPTVGPPAREARAQTEGTAQGMAAVGGRASASGATSQAVNDSVAANTPLPAPPVAKVAAGTNAIAGSGNVAANAAAPVAAPTAMRADGRLGRDRAVADGPTGFAGCYELDASTETFPARFALVSDTVPGMPGLLAVRYLDANGRLADRILDAGWSAEQGRAVVRTLSRGSILTLSRTGPAVQGQSPNGPRTGRVSSCREF